ncbi:hypothetical protein [Nocardiopsis trehalosi]|uniref:hypothetical protein n=1 Tax=Nocardiopsis trehalosi TaxID=109329 RepID=UPI000AA91126|nr:hypothetical protein [Nocardiopsis trehalosi]
MTNAPPRSVSVVALLADIPSTGLLGENQAQRFTLAGDDLAAQSADFLDFAHHHVGQGRRVLALYPKWHAERARRAIAFARGSLQSDQIGQIGLDISPLALSLLADQLAYLAPYVPAGVTAGLAEELPQHILAGAWMKSVRNLATIPITFKQHLGSYLPRTTFLAFCAPVKRVGRVRKSNPAPNIPGRPMEPIQILVARPAEYGIDEFNQQFTPALRPVSLNALPEQPLGSKYWGTRKYVEFVAFSAHPQALANTVRTIRPAACSWCRELVAAMRCPYCGALNEPPVGRPPTRKADVPPPPARTTGEHIRPAWVGGSGPQQAQRPPAPQPPRSAPAHPAPRPPHPDPGPPYPPGRGFGAPAHQQPTHASPYPPPRGGSPG